MLTSRVTDTSICQYLLRYHTFTLFCLYLSPVFRTFYPGTYSPVTFIFQHFFVPSVPRVLFSRCIFRLRYFPNDICWYSLCPPEKGREVSIFYRRCCGSEFTSIVYSWMQIRIQAEVWDGYRAKTVCRSWELFDLVDKESTKHFKNTIFFLLELVQIFFQLQLLKICYNL